MPFINSDSLIFDIGASAGSSVERFLAVADVKQIVSVEPLWESFSKLRDRHFPKTVPIHAAAWSSAGICNIWPSQDDPQLSSVAPERWIQAYPKIHWGEAQFVPTVTLDMLAQTFGDPQLIKIDVEGGEEEVLLGLSRPCPFLIFEFHGKFVQAALNCLTYCKGLGFTRAHYVREDLDLETIPSLAIEEFTTRFLAEAPEWGNITVA